MRVNKENCKMHKIMKKVGIQLLILILLSAGMVISTQAKTAEAAVKEVRSKTGVTLKNTKGKDASDIASIKNFLEQQKKRGNNVSEYEDVNGPAYYWSNDGKLTKLGIDVNCFKGKVSLKGFKNIEYFYGFDFKDSSKISQLDVSDCPKLINLRFGDFNLRKLEISRCPEIEELFCYDNKLSKLDVSKCSKLRYLSCGGNRIKKLDVSKCPELKDFYCSDNKLKKLDISKCPKLTGLGCGGNKLKRLDISKCPELVNLSCYDNQIKKLDVSKCPRMYELRCFNNKLKELDVSKCPWLYCLFCDDNNITELDLSKCSWLHILGCPNNKLKELDVSKCPELEYLSADENLEISGWHFDSDDSIWKRD